jgi:hypothetical protein
VKCESYFACETYFVLLVSLSLIYLTSYFSSPPILCSPTSLGALEQTPRTSDLEGHDRCQHGVCSGEIFLSTLTPGQPHILKMSICKEFTCVFVGCI